MTTCQLATLYVLAGLLEVAGLALIVWEVLAARAQARRMSGDAWAREQKRRADQRTGWSRDTPLPGFIATLAAGNVIRQLSGVVLIGLGLVLQTVANLAAL